MNNLDISVITPSYNMLTYLKRCAASVADQDSVNIEHIIVDNYSNDGTIQWLNENHNMPFIIKNDEGMYDAINKGMAVSKGNIFCYLNCDEQYLPNTLLKVHNFFKNNKDIDIAYGNTLIINKENNLLAFRKTIKPKYYYILAHYLYTYTCSLFFRRNILEDGHLFDSSYKTISDALFLAKLIKEKYKFGYLNFYTSVFTYRENSLSLSPLARDEQKIINGTLPIIVRKLNFILRMFRYSENFIKGKYIQTKPIKYDIFIEDNFCKRQNMLSTDVTPFINLQRI